MQGTQAHPPNSYPNEQPDLNVHSLHYADIRTTERVFSSKDAVAPYAKNAGGDVETAMIVPDISSREELGVPGRPQTDVSQWLSFVYTSLRH